MDRQHVITIVALVLIVIAAMLWFKPFGGGDSYGDNNANLPDGMWFICGDQACKHEFNMSVKEYNAHMEANYGKPITKPPCPKCGKAPAIDAHHCHACGKTSPLTQGADKCAQCGKPFGAK